MGNNSGGNPESNGESDGCTRRAFLGVTLGGALVGPAGVAGTATAQVSDSQFTIGCDYVEVTDSTGIDAVRVAFEDGSFVQSSNGVSLDDGEPVRYGSPGRILDSVTINGTQTVDNPDPCQRRHRATTFTATSVHVPVGEFVLSGGVPSVLTSRVRLHFVDGTTETKQSYSEDGVGDTDDFPELSGIRDTDGMDAVPNVYRGSGQHAGKTIEAIEIETDQDYRRHYLRSDVAEAATLGTETPQERCVEVVGASQGDVSYELTATGPIRPTTINDRIGAGDNDTITRNDDGTWTVSGFTGNTGYGDSFVVNGAITEIRQTGGDGDYVVREMERRVVSQSTDAVDSSPDGASDDGGADGSGDEPTTHEVAVVATEQGEVRYEFTVDGSVERAVDVADDLVAEDNDTITDSGDGTVTVSGYTGNPGYGDTFLVTGDLTAFERTGGDAAFRIELDGETVTADELVERLS
ncbi:hypothetical protein ACAH01_13365 [Halomicrobium sp. HM KBTZ05]|uniref:hypothetical protein n=1 Tax=Halomicrobium sp. HM KBTZ05 TaxID=3242663 RepID=UPI003555EF1E